MSCHVMSCHFMSCHVTFFSFIYVYIRSLINSSRTPDARVCHCFCTCLPWQSDELATYKREVMQAFKAPPANSRVQVEPYGVNPNDGTFLMSFYDFVEFFTHIFAAIDFPTTWNTSEVAGAWEVTAMKHCRLWCSRLWSFSTQHMHVPAVLHILTCPIT